MEKQDILVVAISVLAFAIVALVVKPLFAAQTLGLTTTGSPGGTGITPVVTPLARPTQVPTTPATTTPAPVATISWNGSVQTVGFVGQPGSQVTLPPSPTIPQPSAPNRTLVTYAVIRGTGSGTTENIYIPTPYWVLEYTAVPWAYPPSAYPVLIIQVFDARDPNRVVIEPIRQTIYEEPPDTPWSVKFYEGNRKYYFKIDTSFIKSYTLTIKVPQEYT